MSQNIIDEFFSNNIKKPILKQEVTINSYDEYIKNNSIFRLYFYCAHIPISNKTSCGGVIYITDQISPQLREFTSYYKCMGKSTIIEGGYEGLLTGLKKAISLNIRNLKIFGDSMNIPRKKKNNELNILLNQFNHVEFNHVTEKNNIRAHELANIALNISNPQNN